MTRPLLPVVRHASIDSTQAEARRLVASGAIAAPGQTIVAGEQTGGVGRFGRAWSSPEGGLWMTVCVLLDGDWVAQVHGLGLRLGLGLTRTVGDCVGGAGKVCLKWPNDVLLNDRKVLGVLVEVIVGRSGSRWALIGVGINANNDVAGLPERLRTSATSLARCIGNSINLAALERRIHACVLESFDGRGVDSALIESVNKVLWRPAQPLNFRAADQSEFQGRVIRINDRGCLVIDDGKREIALPESAEVFLNDQQDGKSA